MATLLTTAMLVAALTFVAQANKNKQQNDTKAIVNLRRFTT
ncbi:hypothetical protein P20652_3010 [Pseudoalteromonas sp. BSi20652]|nr:hypothetical protein P20652_3010 [Pseudoalteromonas sp. BSi20652]